MVCVFPSRCLEVNLRVSRFLCLASGHSMVAQAAQANHVGGSLPAVPDRQAREPSGSGRDHHVRHHYRCGHPLSVAGEQHPHTLVQHRGNYGSRIAVAVRGAPDAMRVARPVRRAGRGNGPGAILAPRPGPTPTSSAPVVPRSALLSNGPPGSRSWSTCHASVDGASLRR